MRDDIVMIRAARSRGRQPRIQISEAEIDNFLAEQAGVAARPVEYNIAQILLRVPGQRQHRSASSRCARRPSDLVAQLARRRRLRAAGGELLRRAGGAQRRSTRLAQRRAAADAVRRRGQGSAAGRHQRRCCAARAASTSLKLVGSRSAVEAGSPVEPLQQTRARHILLRVSRPDARAEVAAPAARPARARRQRRPGLRRSWRGCTRSTRARRARAAISAGSIRATPCPSSSARWTR
ncbi:MAG: hypothetical protein MZW92_11475 [Comamonadaceae bacterium]|nr:hypothetical protein [Comamonadaceae bacterium]